MALEAYSSPSDMILGGIPVGTGVNDDREKYVQDAADEIDSIIGFRYKTPVTFPVNTPRPVQLLLKRLNNWLASGRLILAKASPVENQALHAYGKSLVDDALATLQQIASGDILLENVELAPGNEPTQTGPMISNVDPESNVEAFYDRVINPDYSFGYEPSFRFFSGG